MATGSVEVAVYFCDPLSVVDRDVVVAMAGRRVSLANFQAAFCKRIKGFMVSVFKFYLSS